MTTTEDLENKLWQQAMLRFDHAGSRPDLDSRVLIVWTRVEISKQLRSDIAESWRKRSKLAEVSIQFVVRPELSTELEVAAKRMDLDDRSADDEAVSGWDPRSHVLSVTSGNEELQYLIEPSQDWLPLGRIAPSEATGPGAFLPVTWATVPSGELLRYRFHRDELTILRNPVRTGATTGSDAIEVLADGEPLGLRQEVTLVDGAVLELQYRGAEGRAALRLEFNHWNSADLADGFNPNPIPGLQLDITGPRNRVITVAPPSPDTEIRLREFPVFSHSRERQSLPAAVLICTGLDRDNRSWHVKIYRCVTGAHARILRQFLTRQAELTATAARSSARPPMVEVYIADVATTPEDMVVTSFDPEPKPGAAKPRRPAGSVANDDVLASWFGIPEGPGADCYIVALSPLLEPVSFPYRRDNSAPVDRQLEYLEPLARALDASHQAGIAHGDIKSDHLCRRTTDDLSYILIDGDSVVRVDANPVTVRPTQAYAAPSLIALMHNLSAVDERPARTSDRFAFALLVVAAIADTERLADLIKQRPHVKGPVDDPKVAREVIRGFWDPEWWAFADVLADGLDSVKLRDDDYRLADWIARLRSTPAGGGSKVPPVVEVEVVHRDELARIYTDLTGSHRAEIDAALVIALYRERRKLARRAYTITLIKALVTLALFISPVIYVLGRMDF